MIIDKVDSTWVLGERGLRGKKGKQGIQGPPGRPANQGDIGVPGYPVSLMLVKSSYLFLNQ